MENVGWYTLLMTVVVACGGVGDGVVVGGGVRDGVVMGGGMGNGIDVVAVAAVVDVGLRVGDVVGVGGRVWDVIDVGRRVSVNRSRPDVGGAIRGVSTSSAVVDRSAVEDGRAIRPIDMALLDMPPIDVPLVGVAVLDVAVVRSRVLYAVDLALLVAMMATVMDASMMTELGTCPRCTEKHSGASADNSNHSKNYLRHRFSPPR